MSSAPRTKILVMAVCLAILTSVLVYVFLSKAAAEAEKPVMVVTARRDIPGGTIIDRGMIETRQLPGDAVPGDYVGNPDAVVGQVSRTEIQVGTVISRGEIVPKSRLSQIVPPLMRAVTVALDPIIGVGGFIKPGDSVDVVATFTVNGGTVTKTVLQDVKLLATGSEVVAEEVDPETGKPSKPTVQPNATLAVMPTDAEKLILAESKGKLRLTLRRSDDTSYVSSKGVTGREVIGYVPSDAPEKATKTVSSSAPAPRPQPLVSSDPVLPFGLGGMGSGLAVEPEKEPGKTVQIIRGTKVEEAVIE